MKDVTGLPSATSFEVSKLVQLAVVRRTEKRDVKDATDLPSAARFEVSKLVNLPSGVVDGETGRGGVFSGGLNGLLANLP